MIPPHPWAPEKIVAPLLVYGSGMALVLLGLFALVKVGRWALR